MGFFRRSKKRASAETVAEEAHDESAPQNGSANGKGQSADGHDEPLEFSGTGNGAQPPASAPAFVTPTALREAMHELYTRRPSREAFADQALRLMSRVGSIKAAAILQHEARENLLRPIATLGLEPEALELLDGNNRTQLWDIPLRVLSNRRISVIQSAHENPFVPKALVAISPRRLAIAVIPFYHAQVPVGVLVLFSPTQRGLADSLLHAISTALRVCGAGLTQLPSGTVVSRRVEEAQQPTLLRGLKVLKAQLTQLQQALEESERARAAEAAERVTAESFLRAQGDRLTLLEQELSSTRAERDHIPELQGQVVTLTEELRQVHGAAEAAKAEMARLQSALNAEEERVKEQLTLVAALQAHEANLRGRLEEIQKVADERAGAVEALEGRISALQGTSAQADELQKSLAETETARAGATRELSRLRDELTQAEKRQAETRAELERAKAEVLALEAQVDTARMQAEKLAAQEAAVSELRQQVEALEATDAELRNAAREHEAAERDWSSRLAALTAERDQLNGELSRLRDQSGATATELHGRIDDIESERQAMRERLQALANAETERTASQLKVEELQHDLLAVQENLRVQEARVRELSEQSARLIAERRDLHARIEALAAGGQTREQQKQAAINDAQRRVTEVEQELRKTAAQIDATRSAGQEDLERIRAAAEKELRSVQEQLAGAVRDREGLEREVAQRDELLSTLRRESAALGGDSDRLRDEVQRLEKQHSATVAEYATILEAQAERDRRITALEEELQVALRAKEATTTELGEQLAGLTAQLDALEKERAAERERLLQALADKELLLQAAEEGLPSEVSDAEGDLDSMLVIDRSGEPADESELVADIEPDTMQLEGAPEAALETDELLVLDADEAGTELARRLGDFGQLATALTPSVSVTTQISGRRFAQAAINLAAPGAWQTIRALRNPDGQPDLSFIAYALAPGAANGFWLGTVDFVVLPFTEGRLPLILSRLAPRVRRILAMSNDIDVMGDVRSHLSGKGISTAVVLDGRQALDLVPTVRPEAAVLHLSHRCTDVFRAVAGLRSNDASKGIPILFLLDPTEQQQDEAFLAAGLRMLTTRGNFKASELASSLSATLDSVRAVGSLLQAAPPPREAQNGGTRLSLQP